MKSDVVTVCRNCGWYASLGRFLEVDPNWEAVNDGEVSAEQPQTSHLKVWLHLLPWWAWVIIGSVLAVVLESVAVRLATPEGIGGLRTTWSIWQLIVGTVAFLSLHFFNFLTLAAADSEVGVLDILLKPAKLWMRTAANLPQRLWLVDAAAVSITAAAMSPLVIGAIPYDRFWNWGFQEPVKQNLMGAVMDRAKQLDDGKDADNLEDAIGDLAGTQNLDELNVEPEKPREMADCVILGYQLDREGRLDWLVLGTAHFGKLVFAGRVKPDLSPSELADLKSMLASIKTRQPFIAMQSDATNWVDAKYACRVTFGERQKNGQLRDIQWERMLGSLRGK